MVKFLHLLINLLGIIPFVRRERAFGDGEERMGIGKETRRDSGIRDFGGGRFLIDE